MKHLYLIAVLAASTLLLSACQPQTPPPVTPVTPTPIDREVPFEAYTVIADAADGEGITASGFEKEGMPWDRYTLVAAHRGESPSTGYGIRIERILTDGEGRYRVHVSLLDPEPGTPQSDVLTYPVYTVIMAGFDKNAEFEMVVDNTLQGPFEPVEVAFTDFYKEWLDEGQLRPEGGVLSYPLALHFSGVDTALAAYREVCPTTGYDITIVRITMSYDGLISVYVKLTDPEPGSNQAQVITQPVHAVRIRGYSPEWRYMLTIVD